ncbi:hypothetical protein HDU97_002141 [Phlyctochytrium planicorne]|nr:hypothetical protein HDU97_002141 [Phlyctochytrium planicorne]
MDTAASSGSIAMMEYLHKHPDLIANAAENGHLEDVKWIHEHYNSECATTRSMDLAAAAGHLDVVKWLHENQDYGCTTKAMDEAAANGHYEVVNGCTKTGLKGALFSR